MKSVLTTLTVIFLVTSGVFAQSESFHLLENKFKGSENVHALSLSGFLSRIVLRCAGEHDFRKAVKQVKHIRIINIPKSAFEAEQVTVHGFKKVLKKDSFEEVLSVRDHGDDVTLYMKSESNRKNSSYFLLVEEESEVVAIELHGYIDPNVMLKSSYLSSNH
ncbi:DUF4252 domain-containing protein [Chryseosolibacter indicus]|uniref:DUF4252 domain-containing protein n=1 Tax=Chryseosolibacter indicus TaxID=2782351 RepID=A0ABS5VP26_9BACT|nr:DUF4252 domain-containing protein [Chryseosolibacter indicus]MBT1703200.1 DUF4252 domain-containing protein [Chryseosolibacter indicus]